MCVDVKANRSNPEMLGNFQGRKIVITERIKMFMYNKRLLLLSLSFNVGHKNFVLIR